MRPSVEQFNSFYASSFGQVVKRVIGAKIKEAWPNLGGLDTLGIGYATPYLRAFKDARRTICAMPASQGAEIWLGATGKNQSLLVEDEALPFPTALFDRILLIHALENSQAPTKLLCECARLLSPQGRLIVAVAARGGLWANTEKTPLGFGQPYSRLQLETALRQAELEPVAYTPALFVPPMSAFMASSDLFENLMRPILPMFGGMILMEASKRPFIASKRPIEKILIEDLRHVLTGSPIPTTRSYFE